MVSVMKFFEFRVFMKMIKGCIEMIRFIFINKI